MPKGRKKVAAATEAPAAPQVGDKVLPDKSGMVFEISRVYADGQEVDLHVPGYLLDRFRVRVDRLTFVERKPPVKTSNPFTTPQPEIDVSAVLDRIQTVEQDNLKRLDDDISILAKYLKTQNAPHAVIAALEALSAEQQESWKTAIDRIGELLGEG